MAEISNIIVVFFYIVLLIVSIFVVVHATLQIKNASVVLKAEKKEKAKIDKVKLRKIFIVALGMFIAIFFKVWNILSAPSEVHTKASQYHSAAEELALNIEYAILKHGKFNSANDMARHINLHMPIKSMYYVDDYYGDSEIIPKSEIVKFKLEDFEYNPTLITYSGEIMSIIKFKEGCQYIGKSNIAHSDCLIEVDLNNYSNPNQIGQDRTLFAIDGNHDTVKTDADFFKK